MLIDIPAEPSKFAVPVTAPATAIARAVVNVAAEPVVFWLPAAFTPGKLIFRVSCECVYCCCSCVLIIRHDFSL